MNATGLIPLREIYRDTSTRRWKKFAHDRSTTNYIERATRAINAFVVTQLKYACRKHPHHVARNKPNFIKNYSISR